MSWTAIIPLNLGGACKTRLSLALSTGERRRLVEAVAGHVVQTVRAVPLITRIVIVSPLQPPFPDEEWIADKKRGLNVELADASQALGSQHILYIHADLPFVSANDIFCMINGAESHGSSIAPDHTGNGTNALALVNTTGFVPLFGEASQSAHRAALPEARIVIRDGLAFDLDTQCDLDHAVARGFRFANY
jgi:2-phospho-L-lactate/phosphoenolpyruvate guanylyltransferase